MKTYILVLIIRAGTSLSITSIDQPGAYYFGLEACNAAGQEASDNSKDNRRSDISWTCVPRQ